MVCLVDGESSSWIWTRIDCWVYSKKCLAILNYLLNSLVATMRIIQTERKYEKIWSVCFSEAKSQVWLNPKEEMEYDRMVER